MIDRNYRMRSGSVSVVGDKAREALEVYEKWLTQPPNDENRLVFGVEIQEAEQTILKALDRKDELEEEVTIKVLENLKGDSVLRDYKKWTLQQTKELTTAKADVERLIEKRTDDYHASLKDEPGIWGCGKSVYAAIGNLINAHPEKFNIKIEHHFEERP